MAIIRFVKWLRVAAALAVVAALAAPAGATTLIRMGLDDLVTGNQTIVVGKVVGARSYWNEDRSLILSDVRVRTGELLKGDTGGKDLTITIMGGRVGETTALIVAGPEVQVGSEYVLFVNREDLPGANGVPTVRDLCQGIFDVIADPSGPRAISQATRHNLLGDRSGATEPPGGGMGLGLDEMKRQVRSLAAQHNPAAQID